MSTFNVDFPPEEITDHSLQVTAAEAIMEAVTYLIQQHDFIITNRRFLRSPPSVIENVGLDIILANAELQQRYKRLLRSVVLNQR